MKATKVVITVRYAIKVNCGGARGSFLIHAEDGMLRAFDNAGDAEYYVMNDSTILADTGWPWELVEVIGKEDPL